MKITWQCIRSMKFIEETVQIFALLALTKKF